MNEDVDPERRVQGLISKLHTKKVRKLGKGEKYIGTQKVQGPLD